MKSANSSKSEPSSLEFIILIALIISLVASST